MDSDIVRETIHLTTQLLEGQRQSDSKSVSLSVRQNASYPQFKLVRQMETGAPNEDIVQNHLT